MEGFSGYCLRENPFPEIAVIDLSSVDERLNGSIFHEEIFSGEIDGLKRKTQQGVNVVYISGNQSERGLGKSALMIYHMRCLKDSPSSTCVYVRCGEKDKPGDVARKVVEEWHRAGFLWNAFKVAFIEYSKVRGDTLLAPDSVVELFKANPELPDKLPLSLYTHVRDSERLATALGVWAASRLKADAKSLTIIFGDYLCYPKQLTESVKGKTVDPISLFESCIKFLGLIGLNRHYLFLDQFEDMVMGTAKSRIDIFALGMKNIIRASSGLASIFLTLHQRSEMSLKSPNARDMVGVAPFDTIRRIDLMTSETKPDKTISLAEEYFRFFREGEVPYPTFPVKPDLLELVWYLSKGVIRNFLQQLHNALDYGVLVGCPELTLEYALKHPLEVLGKEINPRTMEEFNRWRGKATSTGPSVRSWGSTVRVFKQARASLVLFRSARALRAR